MSLQIFDWTPKHSDNVSIFWLKNENHDTFVKVSRFLVDQNFEFNILKYVYSYAHIGTSYCISKSYTIIPTVLRNGFSFKL